LQLIETFDVRRPNTHLRSGSVRLSNAAAVRKKCFEVPLDLERRIPGDAGSEHAVTSRLGIENHRGLMRFGIQ
ncbi:MAG: hypothetical protein ACTHK7_20910, partial [Aureliella sp.]